MSGFDLTKIAFLLVLLFCSGFFSGSETSFFSLGRVARCRFDKEQETLVLRWIRDLIRRPRRLLITILIGNECVNITASALSAYLTDDFLGRWLPPADDDRLVLKTLAATAFIFPLILILGEVTPKILALLNPLRFARAVVLPLKLFAHAVAPVRLLLESLANAIVTLVLGRQPVEETPLTEREFRNLVDLSREGGELWESEHQFIHNIFEFGDTRVSELMTPRTDMVCVRSRHTLTEVLQIIAKHPFSRIPVTDKDKDDVVGILYSKDLLRDTLEPGQEGVWDLRKILRKPYFIPQTKKASDLFREFRSHHVHLAIVVDEYGGVAGLVTMGDLLGGLFGEVPDRDGSEALQMREAEGNALIVPARMPLDEFNRRLEADLPEDVHDTLGGFVFDLFGRLPAVGSRISHQQYTFTIEKMERTRILEIRVRKDAVAEREPPGASDAPPAGESPEG